MTTEEILHQTPGPWHVNAAGIVACAHGNIAKMAEVRGK